MLLLLLIPSCSFDLCISFWSLIPAHRGFSPAGDPHPYLQELWHNPCASLWMFSHNGIMGREPCRRIWVGRNARAGSVAVGLRLIHDSKIARRLVLTLTAKGNGTEGSVPNGTKTMPITSSPTICKRNLRRLLCARAVLSRDSPWSLFKK
jgi:hypothetical protein